MEYINTNKNINRGYRKLRVWEEANLLFRLIYNKLQEIEVTKLLFKVKAQIEDSAFSVHSNIAEGYSIRHLKENINFNNYAIASLAENYSQIYSLFMVGIIEKEWFELYDNTHYSLENKLIAYNKSQIQQLKDNVDWKKDYKGRNS